MKSRNRTNRILICRPALALAFAASAEVLAQTPSPASPSGVSPMAGSARAAGSEAQGLANIHLQVSKVTRLGRRPVSVGVAAGYFVEHPDAGPSWRLRTSLTLIFPR